jgi:pimeloyl-ACP methyl ester carboxylesterase
MIALLGLSLASVLSAAVPAPETIPLPVSRDPNLHTALHCVAPAQSTGKGVLFIHGASFPTMLAAGFRFESADSWIDFMARKGFLSCGLDFLGYGESSRPAAMLKPPEGARPLIRAPEAAREIATAARYMRDKRHITELHIIAHSWGTIPAATFASSHPDALASLTLFGPIVPIPGSKPESIDASWWGITANRRLEQLYFKNVLPHGLTLLEPAVARNWAGKFAASSDSAHGDPQRTIRIPAGPVADIEAAHNGVYPYAPNKVKAPVFAVYGDYDEEANDTNTKRFLDRFTSSPFKWRLRIDHGTHVLHLERNRWSLYLSVYAFIRATEDRRAKSAAESRNTKPHTEQTP